MPSVFSFDIWQQGNFTFTVAGDETGEIDKRGNPIVKREQVEVKLYFRPQTRTRDYLATMEHKDEYRPRYHCRVVAINGDEENFKLPTSIKVGDTAIGQLNGRECRLTVIDIAQTGVSPIVNEVLGEYIRVELDYSTNRANS